MAILIASVVTLCGNPHSVRGEGGGDISESLRAILNRGGARSVSVSVVDLHSGAVIGDVNGETPMIPASVQKLITTAASLSYLGPFFTFRTEVYTSGSGPVVDRLVVRGGGDPLLTIESAWMLARRVRSHEIREVKNLILDDSFFSDARRAGGDRAYETGTSALSFNFNSVRTERCPGRAPAVSPWELGARPSGDLPQTGGALTPEGECPGVYRSVSDPVAYFGTVFKALLESQGIRVRGTPTRGRPDGARILTWYQSEPLTTALHGLNNFSTNFIAEQIVTVLGARRDAATHSAGVARLQEFISRFHAGRSARMVDGSGLSRNNRVSARLFTEVLAAMHGNPALGPEFVASLPVGGHSGTVKRRRFGKEQGLVVRAKTGTLEGVSSLAGYVTNSAGKTRAFAILRNDVRDRDSALRVEEALVDAIAK